MSYRPQFAAPPPQPGTEEKEFEYYFDETTVPELGAVILSGQQMLRIPLPLERGASFILRGIQVSGNSAQIAMKLYDPFGNELSSQVIPIDRGYSATVGGNNPVGRLPVMVEPAILCPAGCVLLLDLRNLS